MPIKKIVNYPVLNTNNSSLQLSLRVNDKSGNYLIHKVVSGINLLKKQNSSSTKTRSEVSGGGIKPWRQKGTGRARAGSIRSPLWRGGGVIFGPKPKNISFKINKKEHNLALQTLLYNLKNKVYIIPKNILNINKTKELLNLLSKFSFSINKNILIIDYSYSKDLFLSLRNIKNIQLLSASSLNILSLIKAHHILITDEGLEIIKRVYCD